MPPYLNMPGLVTMTSLSPAMMLFSAVSLVRPWQMASLGEGRAQPHTRLKAPKLCVTRQANDAAPSMLACMRPTHGSLVLPWLGAVPVPVPVPKPVPQPKWQLSGLGPSTQGAWQGKVRQLW